MVRPIRVSAGTGKPCCKPDTARKQDVTPLRVTPLRAGGLAGRTLPAVVFPFLRCSWREALCDPFDQHLALLNSHRVGRSLPACLVQRPRGARSTGEPIRRVLPRPSSTLLYPGSLSSQQGLRAHTDPWQSGALVAAFSGGPLHRCSSARLAPACNRARTEGLFSRVP